MILKGKVYRVLPTNSKEYNGKTYTDRDIVLDCSTFDQYTGERRDNFPTINFFGNKCEDLSHFNPGEEVEITFVLNGRKYNDKTTKVEKYFTKVVGYKIERCAQQQVVPNPTTPHTTEITTTFEEADDLPF